MGPHLVAATQSRMSREGLDFPQYKREGLERCHFEIHFDVAVPIDTDKILSLASAPANEVAEAFVENERKEQASNAQRAERALQPEMVRSIFPNAKSLAEDLRPYIFSSSSSLGPEPTSYDSLRLPLRKPSRKRDRIEADMKVDVDDNNARKRRKIQEEDETTLLLNDAQMDEIPTDLLIDEDTEVIDEELKEEFPENTDGGIERANSQQSVLSHEASDDGNDARRRKKHRSSIKRRAEHEAMEEEDSAESSSASSSSASSSDEESSAAESTKKKQRLRRQPRSILHPAYKGYPHIRSRNRLFIVQEDVDESGWKYKRGKPYTISKMALICAVGHQSDRTQISLYCPLTCARDAIAPCSDVMSAKNTPFHTWRHAARGEFEGITPQYDNIAGHGAICSKCTGPNAVFTKKATWLKHKEHCTGFPMDAAISSSQCTWAKKLRQKDEISDAKYRQKMAQRAAWKKQKKDEQK